VNLAQRQAVVRPKMQRLAAERFLEIVGRALIVVGR
jgi:hypothetical protein